MRRTTYFKTAIALIMLGTLGLLGCKKDPVAPKADNCTEVTKKYTEALDRFTKNPKDAGNCEELKSAIREMLDQCPLLKLGSTRSDLEKVLAKPCQ